MQLSKMFSNVMGFYAALSLKCLDAVVHHPVMGVYSEDEVTVRGMGQCSVLITCHSFGGSVL
jgi:hypothetical protein